MGEGTPILAQNRAEGGKLDKKKVEEAFRFDALT